ncbi:MAG: hypothetical protein WC071_10710 [Victivallaceae bacterium]
MVENYIAIMNKLAVGVKSRKDQINYIRELAGMTVEIARAPRMKTIKQRWKNAAAHRKDIAPVWCNPVGCWNELIPPGSLACSDEDLKPLEVFFKKALIKRDIDDDTPVDDYFRVAMEFDVEPANIWGVDIVHESLEETGSAWQYKAALTTTKDFDRLRVPQYAFNRERTASKVAAVSQILAGIMPVKTVPVIGYFNLATICHPAAGLRGMEQMMIDMMLEPELVHRLMNVVLQGVMNFLDAMEASGKIVPNTDEPMFMSDPLRPDVKPERYTLKDCWTAGNSQELDQVSPQMFEEFLLDYQKKIFARFGAVSYGCCENLTNKVNPVMAIPNLRIFVCSAWSNLDKIIESVGGKYCIMWRHKASDVVCPTDTAALKQYINDGARKLQGCSYQVILRELQTLMGHDKRLYEWTQISKDAVEKYS